MKRHILILVVLCISSTISVFAQWTTSGNNVTIDKNIGIGTTNPTMKLDVNGDAYISKKLKLGYTIPVGSGWKISYLEFEGNTLRFNPIQSGYLTAIDFVPGTNSEELANTQMNFYTSDKNANNTKRVMINASGTTFFNGGRFGIGTENPRGKLDVNGDAYISEKLKLGYIIPTGSGWKTSYLEFEGSTLRLNPLQSGYLTAIDFIPGVNSEELANTQMNFYTSDKNSNTSKRVMINASGITFFNGGDVGIGTINPQAKLDVRGAISATEVKVQILTGADHVFNKDYDLKPLSEVESFVKENKHLPEIPSEKQMQTEGLNLNEFQMKLLQKIEELTLYTIQQEKRADEQDRRIKELEKQLTNK